MSELTMQACGLAGISFAAGSALGAFYFSVLWRTVRRLPDSPHPLRLMLISFAARLAPVLAGFYLIMGGRWERLAAALLGFVLIRLVIVHHYGSAVPARTETAAGREGEASWK